MGTFFAPRKKAKQKDGYNFVLYLYFYMDLPLESQMLTKAICIIAALIVKKGRRRRA